MNFMDEEIIEMTKQAREKKRLENIEKRLLQTDITKAIQEGALLIEDEPIAFSEASFFEDKIRMYMPTAFDVMDDDVKDLKYPSSRRPEYIFTSENMSINITMKMMEQQIQAEELEEFTQAMTVMLCKLQPNIEMLEIGMKEVNGTQMGFFDFITPALDDQIYNIMFLFRVDEYVTMGSLNCLKKEMDIWKPIAYGMMESISVENKS